MMMGVLAEAHIAKSAVATDTIYRSNSIAGADGFGNSR